MLDLADISTPIPIRAIERLCTIFCEKSSTVNKRRPRPLYIVLHLAGR